MPLNKLTQNRSVELSKEFHFAKKTWLVGWLALILLALTLAVPAIGKANGGTIIYNQDTGPFNVYLAVSPSPPTPNVPAHLTLLLTKKASDQPVTTATILVEPEMPGMAMPGTTGARFNQTQSRPNQYDVDVPVSMEGMWNFKITISDPQLGQTSFVAQAKVEKPDAPWPIIIAILVALPTLAALTWFFLFRNEKDDDDDDEEDEDQNRGKREVKQVGS
ncbi:MAG TPA: FixH family protein [Chloroflexia bacterium]|nr:FixH family protein [Chloroflexia bacterium]